MNTLLQATTPALLMTIAGPVPSAKKAKQRGITEKLAAAFPPLMEEFKIDTPLRVGHFLSQLAHESDGFCTLEEYASGAAYEGRADLGNSQKGDGVRYKGRTPMQCTGRANYRNFTVWMRKVDPTAPDFEAFPNMILESPWVAWAAIWYWETRKLNTLADRDDLYQITKVINGGTNGLDDRRAKYGRAKRAITTITASEIPSRSAAHPVLYRGIRGFDEAVAQLQTMLAAAGYYSQAVDGDFGAGTENAVRTLQSKVRLKVDGIVGDKTWSAISGLAGAI